MVEVGTQVLVSASEVAMSTTRGVSRLSVVYRLSKPDVLIMSEQTLEMRGIDARRAYAGSSRVIHRSLYRQSVVQHWDCLLNEGIP